MRRGEEGSGLFSSFHLKDKKGGEKERLSPPSFHLQPLFLIFLLSARGGGRGKGSFS